MALNILDTRTAQRALHPYLDQRSLFFLGRTCRTQRNQVFSNEHEWHEIAKRKGMFLDTEPLALPAAKQVARHLFLEKVEKVRSHASLNESRDRNAHNVFVGICQVPCAVLSTAALANAMMTGDLRDAAMACTGWTSVLITRELEHTEFHPYAILHLSRCTLNIFLLVQSSLALYGLYLAAAENSYTGVALIASCSWGILNGRHPIQVYQFCVNRRMDFCEAKVRIQATPQYWRARRIVTNIVTPPLSFMAACARRVQAFYDSTGFEG